MFQLIYTSVPKGLIGGRAGFTTVAMTHGFPVNLIPLMENSSTYERLYQPDDPNAERNPVNYRYSIQKLGTQVYRQLSRIEYSGPGYSRRGASIASHLLLTNDELLALDGEVVRILNCKETFHWNGVVEELPLKNSLGFSEGFSSYAPHCEKLLGDSRWAKVIAWRFRNQRQQPLFFSFDPLTVDSDDILALIGEVLLFLTPQERLDFTFSTYCHQSSQGQAAFLRCYADGSPYLASIQRIYANFCFKLGQAQPIPDNIPWMEMELYVKKEEVEEEPDVENISDFVPPPPSSTSKIEKKSGYAIEKQAMPENKYAKPRVVPPAAQNVRIARNKPTPAPEESKDSKDNKNLVLIVVVVALAVVIGVLAGILVGRMTRSNAEPAQISPESTQKQTETLKKEVAENTQKPQEKKQEPLPQVPPKQKTLFPAQTEPATTQAKQLVVEQTQQPVAEKTKTPPAPVLPKQDVPVAVKTSQTPAADTNVSKPSKPQVSPVTLTRKKPGQGGAASPQRYEIFVNEEGFWANIVLTREYPPDEKDPRIFLTLKQWRELHGGVEEYNEGVKAQSAAETLLDELKEKAEERYEALQDKNGKIKEKYGFYADFLKSIMDWKVEKVSLKKYNQDLEDAIKKCRKDNAEYSDIMKQLSHNTKIKKQNCRCWKCQAKKVKSIERKQAQFNRCANSLCNSPMLNKEIQNWLKTKIKKKEPVLIDGE